MYLKPLIVLAFVCLASFCSAQDNSFVTSQISTPTDLPLHGWNKVLKLNNGNTIVLHLAPNEKTRVKIFDSLLNEIASQSEYFKILGEHDLPASSFEGFYEIGGYPTLFMTQSIDARYSLLRIRFHPVSGKMVDENIAYEGKGNNSGYYISKSPNSDDYAVMSFTPQWLFPDKPTARILYYNGNHKVERSTYVFLNEPHLANLKFSAFHYDPAHGTYVAVTGRDVTNTFANQASKFIYACALPGDTTFVKHTLLFNDGFHPEHAIIKHNGFSGIVNMSISGIYYVPFYVGKIKQIRLEVGAYFASFNQNNFELQTMKKVGYTQGDEYVNRINGKNTKHAGFPMRMFINGYGVPVVISEQHRFQNEYKNRTRYFTDMGDICLTKFDDECEEISGVVIPKRQVVMNDLYPFELAMRETHKYLFRDYREQASNNQYPSFEYLPTRQNNYVFFNDYPSNFGKDFSKSFDTVGYNERTEAVCYQVTRKDEVSSQFLFGKPAENQWRSLLLESIFELPERKEMLALIQISKGKEGKLHLARCRFQ